MKTDITELAAVLRIAAESEIAFRAEGDTSDLWHDEASPDNVLALVEALEKAQQRISELESRPVAPINFKENADADFCREWAWGEIKKDLPAENWSIPDEAAFYAFYLMGWNSRRQFNQQRATEYVRGAMLQAEPVTTTNKLGNSSAIPDIWIPVSERMPEDEQEVLTINKMGYRFVSFFDKHSGLFFDRLDAPSACCIEHVLVTHWMELPAAPQEVVNGQD